MVQSQAAMQLDVSEEMVDGSTGGASSELIWGRMGRMGRLLRE